MKRKGTLRVSLLGDLLKKSYQKKELQEQEKEQLELDMDLIGLN